MCVDVARVCVCVRVNFYVNVCMVGSGHKRLVFVARFVDVKEKKFSDLFVSYSE